VRKIAKYSRRGYTMAKEIIKIEPQRSSDAVSYQLSIRSGKKSSKDNNGLSLTWKQATLELSQKQGYTSIAL
jgi:serine protease inhibitor ecotin